MKLTNILLVLASTCASFLLCEGIVRVLAPQDLSGCWWVYTRDGLFTNKSEGTAFHQLGARRVEYHFAPPHLRELDSDSPPASGPSRKVLVVGDSYTFGWRLADRATYVRRLEDHVNAARPGNSPRFHFLDAAAGGWGAVDYTVYLRDYLPHIHPDYVLIFVNTDDIGRAMKSPLISFEGKLAFRQGPPHRLKALVISSPFYSYLLEHSQLWR